MDLTEIKRIAEEKYGPFPFKINAKKTVLMKPAIRLTKDQRAELKGLLDTDADTDVEERLEAVIRMACNTEADAKAVIAACGGDIPILVTVVTEWAKATKVGEA